MHEKAILTTTEVCQLLGIGRQRIYDFLKNDPTFPKPCYMSERRPRWVTADLVAWLKTKLNTAPTPLS